MHRLLKYSLITLISVEAISFTTRMLVQSQRHVLPTANSTQVPTVYVAPAPATPEQQEAVYQMRLRAQAQLEEEYQRNPWLRPAD